MPSLKPLADRVVVERSEPEEKTAGGIVLPDSAKDKPKEGRVIAAGPGKVLPSGQCQALDLKAGDRVLFSPYAGSEVQVDGKEYLILKEEEVLAILS